MLSPGQENFTEKKPKHTDTESFAESVANGESSAWCDIEDSDYKLNELTFDMKMTHSRYNIW